MEEEKTNDNKAEEVIQEPATNNNKNIKIILIVIGVLVVFGMFYRVNTYFKYKKVERNLQKQAEVLEKQGKEIQANYMKQLEQVQKNLLEEQKKQLKELQDN